MVRVDLLTPALEWHEQGVFLHLPKDYMGTLEFLEIPKQKWTGIIVAAVRASEKSWRA